MNIYQRLETVCEGMSVPSPADVTQTINAALSRYEGDDLVTLETIYCVIIQIFILTCDIDSDIHPTAATRLTQNKGVTYNVSKLEPMLQAMLYTLSHEIIMGTCPDFDQ